MLTDIVTGAGLATSSVRQHGSTKHAVSMPALLRRAPTLVESADDVRLSQAQEDKALETAKALHIESAGKKPKEEASANPGLARARRSPSYLLTMMSPACPHLCLPLQGPERIQWKRGLAQAVKEARRKMKKRVFAKLEATSGWTRAVDSDPTAWKDDAVRSREPAKKRQKRDEEVAAAPGGDDDDNGDDAAGAGEGHGDDDNSEGGAAGGGAGEEDDDA